MAGAGDVETIFLCIEASDLLLEPMCSTWELQQELVPYVLSHSLQHDHFLKLPKAERQSKVKILTQRILSGETGAPSGDEEESPGQMRMVEALSPHRFWAHLRAKYGTRLGSILDMLQLLEPFLRPRRVCVLRFEGEVNMPSASLILRASRPCPGAANQETWQKDFEVQSFNVAALNTWLSEACPSRAPPLWSRLAAAKEQLGVHDKACALVLCAQASSTETIPEALAVAGRSLCEDRPVPCLSAVSFGADFTSERLQALEELCAWSGGLSFNVDEPGMLRPAAEGLAAHLFGEANDHGRFNRFLERRRYYAQKQELGTCFMELPCLVKHPEGESTPSVTPLHLHRTQHHGLPALLVKASAQPIDCHFAPSVTDAVPSESMLTVLSDVTLILAHRWSRSLRVWRIRRGMRDLVFGEPGSIGLDFEEPTETGNTWRLRATHPPASALKMQEGSELVAINRVRVTERTPRSEVARRISSRPVSLTFRLPKSNKMSRVKEVPNSEIFPMVVSEIVVSELREGLLPLKKAQPPLSTALQKHQEVKARKEPQHLHQAARILNSVQCWGTMPGSTVPAWVEDLRVDSPLGKQWAKTASLDLFAREPGLLFRVLMFCGEASTLCFAGRSCSTWQKLLLDTAQRSSRQLWSWVLRHGQSISSPQRPNFWHWCCRSGEAFLAGLQRAASVQEEADSPEESLLEAAARCDASGSLSRLSSGLGGAAPSLEVATGSMQKLAKALGLQRLPSKVLDGLLQDPWHCQRLWLLSDAALPWLVMQCRYFQVVIAAHLPNLFRHMMGEGLAPELFYCRWIQGLFQGCLSVELQLRIMDHFIFERSLKIFVKLAVAIFTSLEKRLIGQDIEKMMDLIFDPKVWEIDDEQLMKETLGVKVTRSMLKEIQ